VEFDRFVFVVRRNFQRSRRDTSLAKSFLVRRAGFDSSAAFLRFIKNLDFSRRRKSFLAQIFSGFIFDTFGNSFSFIVPTI
jgi:hypothetical protein